MKNIISTIVLLSLFTNCKAQVIGIENSGAEQAGFYYKDLNNFLNTFEGTYFYNNGNTSLEIKLQKKIASNRNNILTEDLLIGAYIFTQNGNEIINNLNSLDIYQSNGRVYSINGNNVNKGKYRCHECEENEKWLRLTIRDNNYAHPIFIRKANISGVEAIKIYILPAQIPDIEDNSPSLPSVILPVSQWITLIKQ